MPNYSVNFNGSGKVSVPFWYSGTGEFSVRVKFNTGSTLATTGLVGDGLSQFSDSYLVIYNTGKYRVKFDNQVIDYHSAENILSINTNYEMLVERVSTDVVNIVLFAQDGITVIDSTTITNGTGTINFDRIGSTGGVPSELPFQGVIHQVETTGGTQARNYLSTVNTGTVWTDTISGQNGTLIGLATNGSEWVLSPTPIVTPIFFTGTLSDLVFTDGDIVSEDFSSHFSGSELPLTSANTGTTLVGSGLTLNNDFTLTGTAAESTIADIVVTGTDSAANTASSNLFSVTVNAIQHPTRAEIEAADETGGKYPPFLVNDFTVDDLSTDRFNFTIDTLPSAGTLTVTPLSTFTFVGAPQGVYTFTYTGFKNGVSYGTGIVTIRVGVSDIVITNTDTPDGTYSTEIYNTVTKTGYIENVTFTGGNANITATNVPVGTKVWYMIEGANPPTTGVADVEITV